LPAATSPTLCAPEITVLEDLCRDRDEEVHRLLTEKVFPPQCEVMLLEAVRAGAALLHSQFEVATQ
jgi:hypothetical protein